MPVAELESCSEVNRCKVFLARALRGCFAEDGDSRSKTVSARLAPWEFKKPRRDGCGPVSISHQEIANFRALTESLFFTHPPTLRRA